MCVGTARVLQGNSAQIGKPGGFSGSSAGNFPVTANGAAIMPSQLGMSKSALRPYIGQISGVPQRGCILSRCVGNHWRSSSQHYQSLPVQQGLIREFPGSVIIELPGGRNLGTTAVTLTLPTAVGCPAGTVMVP